MHERGGTSARSTPRPQSRLRGLPRHPHDSVDSYDNSTRLGALCRCGRGWRHIVRGGSGRSGLEGSYEKALSKEAKRGLLPHRVHLRLHLYRGHGALTFRRSGHCTHHCPISISLPPQPPSFLQVSMALLHDHARRDCAIPSRLSGLGVNAPPVPAVSVITILRFYSSGRAVGHRHRGTGTYVGHATRRLNS